MVRSIRKRQSVLLVSMRAVIILTALFIFVLSILSAFSTFAQDETSVVPAELEPTTAEFGNSASSNTKSRIISMLRQMYRFYKSEFVSQSVPEVMQPGEKYEVSVTFKNTAKAAWKDNIVYLMSQNPRKNNTWGRNKVELDKKDKVAQGESKTFTFEITAPETPGTYNFQWQLYSRKFRRFFGEKSLNLTIEVAPPPLELDPIGNKSTYEHQLLEFQVSAEGPGILTYSASNLPSGASFDPQTQKFSWLPNYNQAGTYNDVYFEVTNGAETVGETLDIDVLNTVIFGTIYEEGQVPLEGVTIQILDITRTNVLAETQTDYQGKFDIYDENWPDGTYIIRASKSGYKTYDGMATLRNGWMMPFSVTLNNIPPASPMGLEAVGGDNIVDLSWDANAELDLAGYNVYRSETEGGPYDKVNLVLITETTFSDTTVQSGITYYYVITAEDVHSLESGYSQEAEVTPYSPPPPAPILNTAVGGENQVTLNWDAVSGADYYQVYYRTLYGSYGDPISVGDTTEYVVMGLSAGTKYYLAVTAVNSGGESEKSNEKGVYLPGEEVIIYTYDDLNRLENVQYDSKNIHYDYDEIGNLNNKSSY